ncbi:hypothetical protein IJI31_05940 [bacterium]|nr:hypothetical protein [bacterium]
MQINRVSNISYGSGLAKAAIVSAMMAGSPSAQAQEVKADTFEIAPKTEYVSQVNDIYDDVFVYGKSDTIKNPKARGNQFNNWVNKIMRATDDDGQIDTSKLNGTPINFMLKEGESFTDLAESIVASYDQDDDKKVDFDEFLTKSYSSIPLNSNQGTYMSKQFYRSLDDLFFGFDINESFNKKLKSKNTIDVKEVAASLMAMSGTDYDGRKPKSYIDGQQLMDEVNFMMFHGEADPEFREAQEIYYENIK